MGILFILVEVTLQTFSSWTLAYHFSLLVNLPAKLIIIPFLAMLCPMVVLSWRRWWHAMRDTISERWFLLGTVLLALGMGTFILFISNPNPDDYNFFHRALVQLQHLDAPFILTDTGHNVSGLPPLSPSHVLTSYEPFVAITAALAGIDPLGAYHNVSAFIAEMLLTVFYVLLYRQFGLDQTRALAATVFAFLFFFLDIRLTSRSFGNIVLYLWVGKVFLWGVLIPITLLVAYRFLSYPTSRRFSLVAMAGICATGLSGSGVFMIPTLIFAVSLAYVLSYGFSKCRLKGAVILNLASLYCVVVGVGLLMGLIPRPADVSAWSEGFPSTWWENLGLVISDRSILLRDLLILLVLPLISLVRPLNRFFTLLSLVLFLIFANPLLGPLWIKTTLPGAYWRLLFLFPTPWCFGLTVHSFIRHIHNKYASILIRALATIGVLATLNAYLASGMTLAEIRNVIHFKLPWEYRLPPVELTFARSVSKHLQNRDVLAPESLVVVLALINPTTRFEATRGTLHTFTNAGQRQEGLRRIAAQSLVTTCAHSPDADAAFLRSLEMGVNAIIIRDCGPESLSDLADLMALAPGQWAEVARNNGYILLLRRE